MKRLWLTIVFALVMAGCSATHNRTSPQGNGDSFNGTQYLETIVLGLWPALLQSVEDIAANPSADHCSSEVESSPLSATLNGLTATQRASCSEHLNRMAPLLRDYLKQGFPEVRFVEEQIDVPLDLSGLTGPATAATLPNHPIYVVIQALEKKDGPVSHVLGAVLGHEIGHQVEDAAAAYHSELGGHFHDDLDPASGFANAKTLLNILGAAIMTHALEKGYYDDGRVKPRGATGNEEPSYPTLSCTVSVSGSASIPVDQMGTPTGRSSAVGFTVAANLPIAVESMVVSYGNHHGYNGTYTDPKTFRFDATFSHAGTYTMTTIVRHVESNQSVACATPYSVQTHQAAAPLQIYRLYQATHNDHLHSPYPTEGHDGGYYNVNNPFKVYNTPTPACGMRLDRVVIEGKNSIANDFEGLPLVYAYGYCCGVQVHNSVPLHRLRYGSSRLAVTQDELQAHLNQGWQVERTLCYVPR